jgi:hypothetical protein
MFTLTKLIRFSISAGLAAGLLATAGCQQLSKTLRSDRAIEEQSAPTPPDLRTPTPNLEPVPQKQPSELVLPPPAPASDAAIRERRGFEEREWEIEDIEVADQDEDEFFPEATSQNPRAFLMERTEAAASRFAQKGQEAAERRKEPIPRLPVIVPAGPGLRRVSAEGPALLPVPR